MKLKVLECPLWIKHAVQDISSDFLSFEFDVIKPLFNRDGYYLIDNQYVVIEYQGTAWKHKNNEKAKRAFYWELEDAESEGINLLSKEQSDAICTLIKVGLASEEQQKLLGRHLRKKSVKKFRSSLKCLKNIDD